MDWNDDGGGGVDVAIDGTVYCGGDGCGIICDNAKTVCDLVRGRFCPSDCRPLVLDSARSFEAEDLLPLAHADCCAPDFTAEVTVVLEVRGV